MIRKIKLRLCLRLGLLINTKQRVLQAIRVKTHLHDIRLAMLSIESNDLSTMSMFVGTVGPSYMQTRSRLDVKQKPVGKRASRPTCTPFLLTDTDAFSPPNTSTATEQGLKTRMPIVEVKCASDEFRESCQAALPN